MHICNYMHRRSLFADTEAGVECQLCAATCMTLRRSPSLLFVEVEEWRKVYAICKRVASAGQCRMRCLRLGIPSLLFLRRRMPRPIKHVWVGHCGHGRATGVTQTAVPASPSYFNRRQSCATCTRTATVACHSATDECDIREAGNVAMTTQQPADGRQTTAAISWP